MSTLSAPIYSLTRSQALTPGHSYTWTADAVSAHGRMTAAALSAIPAAVAVLMFYTNPDYVKFFFKDETGNIMLGAAVFLQLVGYLIMKKIVNIEV